MLTSLASLADLVLLMGCGDAPAADPALSAEMALFADADATATSWAVGTLATPTLEAAFLATSLRELSTTSIASLPASVVFPSYANARTDDGRNNYLTGKASAVYPSDSDLDPGWMVGAAYGRYFTRLFSVEFEASYFEPDVDGTSSVDMFAVPLMVNGRLSLPIWLLQIYGGAGIGAIYYDVDGGSFDGDGWIGGGNAFLGADITLFDRLGAGLELKYYITEELHNSDTNLDGLAVTVTVSFRF